MGAAETTGARGQRVGDVALSSWIDRAESEYASDRWDEDFVEVMLDLRETRTTLAASEARVAELERQVAEAKQAGMEQAARIADDAAKVEESFAANRLWNGGYRCAATAIAKRIRAAMPAAAAKEG